MALKKITTVDAAESVSSSANLYVEDSGAFKRITPAQAKGLLGVDELKSAIYENPKIVASFISGARTVTGEVSTNTKRCTTPSLWDLKVGDTVSLTRNAAGQKYALAGINGTAFIYDSGWRTADLTYTISTSGKYFVNIATTSGTDELSPSAVTLIATVTDNTSRIAVAQKEIDDLSDVVNVVKDELSVESRNILPKQPDVGVATTFDLGADVTFPNGIGVGFDAVDLVTEGATAGLVDFKKDDGTRAAIITLNSFRNNNTGIVFANETSPHNGRYNNASVAAFRESLTFRYIIINNKTPQVSSGAVKNFSITEGFSPTPYIPHDAAKDYAIEQGANPFDLYAEVNKTSIMDVGYWGIKTDVCTNSFGAINTAGGGFTTRLFPAKAGDVLRYKFSTLDTWPMLLIYDGNMQVIPSETVLGTGAASYISGEHTFTEGECFFRLNGAVNHISKYSLSYNDVPVVIKDYVKSYVDGYAVGQRTFPAYWDTAVGNAVTAIKNQLLAMETGDCFFFVTDQHWTSNAQRSSSIIDYVSEKTGVYNVFIGGDVVSSNNASQVGAMTEMLDYLGSFKGKNVRLFSTLGNHDRNSVAQTDQTLWLSLAQQYNALIKPEEEWLDTNGTPLCNVYDNKSQKVRYIQFWYTADSGYSDDVATALVSAMTSAPNDYTIVLMSHAYWNGIDPAQAAVRYANLILDTMDTMTATVALWVCGHVHKDYTTVLTSTGGKSLRIMSTTTDSVGQHPTNPSLTVGTDTEQAFDVYCIDTTAKTINAIRVGAGESRSFTY